MLETAKASYVLCDRETRSRLPEDLPCQAVEAVERAEEVFEDVKVGDEDLVNVMFTSGSTGKPKGVMLRHRSVSSLFVSIRELLSRAGGPPCCSFFSIRPSEAMGFPRDGSSWLQAILRPTTVPCGSSTR